MPTPTISPLNTIYPLNTFYFAATLRTARIVSQQVREVPLETGPVTAFLATSDAPTATAANPNWSVSAEYSGADGKWLITIPGSVLQPSDMAAAFADAAPWLVVVQPDNVRVVFPLAYAPSRRGALA